MILTEKEIKTYISDVGNNLFCSRKQKKQILADIKNEVLTYAENKRITDINEIYAHFGTPEEIAKAYIADAEPQNIKKAINIRKLLVAAVAIVLAMLAITFIIAIVDSHNANAAYFTDTPIEVITTLPQISD
ncbi:MAG: hypothetical protein IJO14_05165 [Clostridia bacterium]|nr:hypothetical protein [Clostridia bacterium]